MKSPLLETLRLESSFLNENTVIHDPTPCPWEAQSVP